LQLWVESGIFPLLVFLVLLVLSWRRAGALRGLIIGFVVYNIFYQGLAQPVLWLALALVWFAASQLEVERLRALAPQELAS